jgi:GR25 family glycosyltransferase involved in LPS biosynthesis
MNDILDNLLGKNNWSAHCINLERAIDRRETFANFAKDIELNFDFYKAVDKKDLKKEELFVYINNDRYPHDGGTACFMSHNNLYNYLLENYNCEYFFILEDDAGFKNSNKKELFDFFESVKKININWGILEFGYHDTGFNQRINIDHNLCLIQHKHLTHAFLIKRECIIFMLEEISKNKNLDRCPPIDWIKDFIFKKTVVLGPRYTIIDQVDSKSYIFLNSNLG